MTGTQSGKVAIVTGGTVNMGKLFAASLAQDGADVVVHYNSPHRADEVARPWRNCRAAGYGRSRTRAT